jgi:SMC interacting uncharacterized protein involved in chromosome segregation
MGKGSLGKKDKARMESANEILEDQYYTEKANERAVKQVRNEQIHQQEHKQQNEAIEQIRKELQSLKEEVQEIGSFLRTTKVKARLEELERRVDYFEGSRRGNAML